MNPDTRTVNHQLNIITIKYQLIASIAKWVLVKRCLSKFYKIYNYVKISNIMQAFSYGHYYYFLLMFVPIYT